MALYVKDLSDLVQAVVDELKIQDTDSAEITRIKRDINLIYLDEVVPFKRWLWLSGNVNIEHKPYYSNGSASVTPNSVTVELSVAPATSRRGQLFAIDNFDEIYRIEEHEAGETTVTLSSPFTGMLNAASPYKIWTDEISLPTDCRETIEVWHDHMRRPVEGKGLQELRRIVAESGRQNGRPLYYSTYDYEDPTQLTAEGEVDRYRKMKLHPAIYENSTTLHIDYVKEALPLILDGDEPIMALEDRVVLVYGALARAWRRARNPEESANNQALFDRKLARMAGKLDDSQDKPSLEPASNYLAKKRGRSSRLSGSPFSTGGSYTAPSYLVNATINGGNLTGNLTAASGITVDGRDVSADGIALDEHLDAIADAHPATAIAVTPIGNLEAETVQEALEELQEELDNVATSTDLDEHIADASGAHAASAVSVVPSGNLAAGDVQAALSELQDDVDTRALAADLTAHVSDSTDAHAASAITNTPTGNLVATTVQAALDELQADVDARIPLTQKGAVNGVATLGADGKIPVGQVPSIALVDVFVVADIAARDALTVEEGDVARVTDNGSGVPEVYMYNGTSWVSLKTNGELLLHTSQATGAHAASAISVVPAGNLSSTTAQAALTELQGDIDTNNGKLANVVAPSTGKSFEVSSTTGALVGPRMTTTQRDAIASPAAGYEIYNTTTNKKQIHDGTAWVDVGSGSGSGGIDYMTNGKAELGTTGWTRYYNAGYTPTTGTGAPLSSTDFTFTTSTTTPLRGLSSFVISKTATAQRGEGVAYDFAIDDADKASILEIRLEHRVLSGTYTNGQVRVYLLDVTNNAIASEVSTDIPISTLRSTLVTRFQTASNAKNYRLMFHCSDLSTAAYQLQVDSISVGPQVTSSGSFTSDWVSYTPVFTGMGTVSNINIQSRRNAGSLEIRGSFVAGTGAATGATFSMGFNGVNGGVVTSIPSANSIGGVGAFGFNSASVPTAVLTNATSFVGIGLQGASNTGISIVAGTAFTSGNAIFFDNIVIPIAGWGSSQVLSSDAGDGRVVALSVKNNVISGTIATSVGASSNINFGAAVRDTTGSWNGTTFTIPTPGDYFVEAGYELTGSGGTYWGFTFLVNGAERRLVAGKPHANSQYFNPSTLLPDLKAGDVVSLRIYTDGSSPAFANSAVQHLSLFKISTGNQQIAASESVSATALNTASTSIPNNAWTLLPFNVVTDNTHGALSVSGVFTCPAPGRYMVISTSIFTGNATGSRGIRVRKNNADTGIGVFTGPGSNGNNFPVQAFGIVSNCITGTTLSVELIQSSGGALSITSTGDVGTSLSIYRVGNY